MTRSDWSLIRVALAEYEAAQRRTVEEHIAAGRPNCAMWHGRAANAAWELRERLNKETPT